jgi:hypothetical protein
LRRHLRDNVVAEACNGCREESVEEWEIFDKLGVYQQLGVAPPSSPG